MKYIQKGLEPVEFIEWKALSNKDWQADWNNFQKPEKVIVHQALLNEQGYICCYCEQRLNKTTSHIEHFRPRETYPDLTLIYNNFLCSCPGWKQGKSTDPQEHCGASKANWFDEKLMVSPLNPDCEKYFQYTAIGEIRPNYAAPESKAAEATINHCKLNHAILIKMREEALEGLDDLTQDEAIKLIKSYQQRDVNGQYEAFCSVISYFLSNYYGLNKKNNG